MSPKIRKTFLLFLLIISSFLFVGKNAESASLPSCSFSSSLYLGMESVDVQCLQRFLNLSGFVIAEEGYGSPGNETFYFGSRTKNAIVRFQEKYKNEILLPVGLSRGTGFVGAMTIKKMNELAQKEASTAPVPPSSSVVPAPAPIAKTPSVTSVFPNRVRTGNTVTISGKNFTPTGNTVTLGDGPVNKSFPNLPSPDGKTITFVFNPPQIQTMSEEEVRSLPANVVEQIEKPIKAAGGVLGDVFQPYKNFKSESELKESLQKNGHLFDELYNFYFVTVENSGGKTTSSEALLYGLRELPIGKAVGNSTDKTLSLIGQYFKKLYEPFFGTAYAEMKGGGFNTGIIMICTCGDGYMTFMVDYGGGGGTGLYVFSWGFMPNTGSAMVGGMWLGGYQIMGGSCSIYVGVSCIDIPGNSPEKPWGAST